MTTSPAQDPKKLLAELIDAYASAKVSGNEMLMKMAIGPLNEFIVSYDFVPSTPSAPYEGE
jgi:hypothetical protein